MAAAYAFAIPSVPDIAARAGYNAHDWYRLRTDDQARLIIALYDARARAVLTRGRSLGAEPALVGGTAFTTGGASAPMTPQEIDAALRGINPDGSAMTPAQQATAQARIQTSTAGARLPQSNFTVAGKRAWWTAKTSTGTYVCVASGGGVLSTMQAIMRDALRAPWTSYNGTHTHRPGVDGNFGPETAAALYAYAKKAGYMAGPLAQVKTDLMAKRITPAVLLCAITVTYYMPRQFDQDIAGHPTVRKDPALLGMPPSGSIALPPDVVPWKFLERPAASTTAISQDTEIPVCTLQSAGWTLGQAVLPQAMPGDLGRVPGRPSSSTPSSTGSSGGILALAALAAAAVVIANS